MSPYERDRERSPAPAPAPEPEPGPDAESPPETSPPSRWGRQEADGGEFGWGLPEPAEPDRGWRRRESPRAPHPMDLEPEEEEPWNPRIRRAAPYAPARSLGQGPKRDRGRERSLERDDEVTVPASWDSLPPSARLHGSPADPGERRRGGGRVLRRWAGVLVALVAAAGLVTGATVVVLRLTTAPPQTARLSDSLAGITVALPRGWQAGPVAPVTGFTSVIRDGSGGLVMARPVPGPVENVKKATAEAAELYSRLLLKGDRVTVVEDKQIPEGHTRAMRAEYQDVVNRPAFLRVMLLTRDGRAVLLVGLLQPEENTRRQALDAVMTSIR
ncbi:hypothetical protein [Nonomuraea rosea]|uniref:hypothetical protein n=1 Tax=Nonomuraea rosea TaxID=638574 RepID=UPI0031E7A9AE